MPRQYPFFFNNNENNLEYQTFESIYQEAVELYGYNVIYIKQELFNKTEAFGEFRTKILSSSKQLRMFIEQVQGFNNNLMFSKFGIRFEDSIDIYCPKITLEEYQIEPKLQDLIFVPVMNRLFEITYIDVNDDKNGTFFPLGKNFAYHFSCKLYNYDYSEIDINDNIQNLPQLEVQKIENLLNINNLTTNSNKQIQNEKSALNIIDDSEKDNLL